MAKKTKKITASIVGGQGKGTSTALVSRNSMAIEVTQQPIVIQKIAQYNGEVGRLTAIINGKTFQKMGHRDLIAELVELCEQAHENQDAHAYKQLMRYINPFQAAIDDGILTRADNGDIYFMGIPVPVPASLTKTMVDYISMGHPLDSLKKFWMLCLLNPNIQARDKFFDYCLRYGVVITTHGHAVLYKAVTYKKGNQQSERTDLVTYIAQERVNAVQRRMNLNRYMVYELPDGTFRTMQCVGKDGKVTNKPVTMTRAKAKQVGRLDQLLDKIGNLEQEIVYTDKHTREMTIRIGQPVSMERSKCDPDINRDCSYGLHVGSFKYVSEFGGSGDPILACLVNPMHVVAIPAYDTSKIRVCQYVPYGRMERDHNSEWVEISPRYFEASYIDYQADELKERMKHAKDEIDEEARARASDFGIQSDKDFDEVFETVLEHL